MRRIIRIRRHGFVGERSDNLLSEFQPIWSRGWRFGTRNARTSRLFFTFEKQRKTKIRRHPSVMRLSHQGRNCRGINFLYNNRSVTVNMEQVQIELPAKKRHKFLMRRIIRIRRHGFVGERSDNLLSEFQPIWSRGWRFGTRNARTSRLFFTFEKQRKTKIRRHPSVMRLSHQGRNCRGINFLYNNRSVTVNMEQVQISRDGARLIVFLWINRFFMCEVRIPRLVNVKSSFDLLYSRSKFYASVG